MRTTGYYWVKREIVWHGPPVNVETVWEVARYEYGRWYLSNRSINDYDDSYFLEIDERQIVREAPKPSAEEIAEKTERLRISQERGDRINDIDWVV